LDPGKSRTVMGERSGLGGDKVIKGTNVRSYAKEKGMRVSARYIVELEGLLRRIIEVSAESAKKKRRKTLMPADLEGIMADEDSD